MCQQERHKQNVAPGQDGSCPVDFLIHFEGEITGRLAQLGLFRPAEGAALRRVGGTLFESTGAVVPVAGGRILQGFREGSNVAPMTEIARMIEVQRAYELGQSFLETEDERVRRALESFTR